MGRILFEAWCPFSRYTFLGVDGFPFKPPTPPPPPKLAVCLLVSLQNPAKRGYPPKIPQIHIVQRGKPIRKDSSHSKNPIGGLGMQNPGLSLRLRGLNTCPVALSYPEFRGPLVKELHDGLARFISMGETLSKRRALRVCIGRTVA